VGASRRAAEPAPLSIRAYDDEAVTGQACNVSDACTIGANRGDEGDQRGGLVS